MATEEALTIADATELSEEDIAIATIVADNEIPPFEISPDPANDPLLLADGSAELNGFAAPNATVDVVLDGAVVQSFSAEADGSWRETITIEEIGTHTLQFIATDENGTAIETEPITFFRYIAPTIEFTPATEENPNQVALSGTAEADAKIGVEANGTLIDITRADRDGEWRWVGTLPADADNEFELRAVMLADDNTPLVAGAIMEVALPNVENVVEQVIVEEETTPVEEAAVIEQVAEVEAPVVEVAPAEGLAALKLPDALASEGRFNTLYAALDLTGNIYTLKLDEPFSIFAPTDAAFGRLPERVLE